MIPVNEPVLDGNEKKYLNQCIDTGWISSEGPFVKQLEEKFSSRVDRKYGIAVTNGSAALDVAVQAIRIGPGDEVILPAFTIISCAASIIRAGATPVLVDSDPHNWNMDIQSIKKKITPRTKAIMVVHIYGLPVNMQPILSLADEYGLKVIEDAAEMIGQTYKGAPCGSFGDISTFSFYPNKHITTGEGGMVVTDDPELAENCRSLRNLCFQKNKRFVHEKLGWNFRMSNIQAALGVAQLERLDEFIKRKRFIGKLYNELLGEQEYLQLPLAKTDYAENIYWVYGLLLTNDFPYEASEIMKRMAKHNIGTRPFFWPMHQQPVLNRMGLFRGEKYPVSEKLARKGFYIPSGLALTEYQQQEVSKILIQILNDCIQRIR